jgi:hypothetical protein
MKAMNQNLLDKKLPAAVKRAWSKAVYINQAVTRQTLLQLVPDPPIPNWAPPDPNRAPPDPNRGPPGLDPARKPSRTSLGRLALTRCCRSRCRSCDGDCIGCRCRSCRRWRGEGDGGGVGMLMAFLLQLLRQCCCSQAVSRQTRLQLVPAPVPPHPILVGSHPAPARLDGRAEAAEPARPGWR